MIRSPQRQLAPVTVGPGIDETTSLRGIADMIDANRALKPTPLRGAAELQRSAAKQLLTLSNQVV
jgi:hypothetical protein